MYQPSSRFMKYKRRAKWPMIALLACIGFLSHLCSGQVGTTIAQDFDGSSASPTAAKTDSSDPSDKVLPADPSSASVADLQESAGGQSTSAGIPLRGNFFQRLGQFYIQDW